jgi:hypothetical protein
VASLAGKLAVVNLRKPETDQAHSVVATVRAGCGSARALVSGNGKVVWVTARQSGALLGFSALALRTDPKHALIARVVVVETPLGETLIDHGARILVGGRVVPVTIQAGWKRSTSAACHENWCRNIGRMGDLP